MTGNILIISNEPLTVCVIKDALDKDGHTTRVTADGITGRHLLKTNLFDIVMMDITMLGIKALDLVSHIRTSEPAVQIIVLTRAENMDTAHTLVRSGAYDYLLVPDDLSRLDRLQIMVQHAFEKRRTVSEKQGERPPVEKQDTPPTESQSPREQKMNMLGGLAGCIAHDFNNLLTTMIGNATLIQTKLNIEDPLYEPAQQIQVAGDRANELVKQLLAFNRSQTLHLDRRPLNEVISRLEAILRQVIHKHMDLTIDLEPSTEPMLMDRMQLEQVIMNLVVNARDAMPDGGVLTMRTKTIDLNEYEAHQHALPPGRYARLDVQDTGIGMDETVQAHIFETFFTTKKHGKGNGVGLSTVYNIVTQTGGTINVSSTPGMGTTFSIYLPILILPKHFAGHHASTAKQGQQTAQGPHTILVVDDEESVRVYAQKILEQANFTVIEAANGVEGLARMDEHSGPVTLVVTDIKMPKMDGNDFVKKLQEIYPDTKTIFITGLPEPFPLEESLCKESIPLLTKPFGVNDLLRCVRKTLAYPDSSSFKPL